MAGACVTAHVLTCTGGACCITSGGRLPFEVTVTEEKGHPEPPEDLSQAGLGRDL